MAHPKVDPDIVIERLMHVFRSVGYDGASLAELATSTGLKKASLYHRFPDGKVGMANAVLDYVAGWSDSQIFEVLYSSEPAPERMDAVLNSINVLYGGGQLACILGAMAHGTAAEIFRDKIGDLFQKWISAFIHLATDLGHDSSEAKRLGESALIRIQGSLIIAQTMQKTEFFQDTLNEIKADFLR